MNTKKGTTRTSHPYSTTMKTQILYKILLARGDQEFLRSVSILNDRGWESTFQVYFYYAINNSL